MLNASHFQDCVGHSAPNRGLLCFNGSCQAKSNHKILLFLIITNNNNKGKLTFLIKIFLGFGGGVDFGGGVFFVF